MIHPERSLQIARARHRDDVARADHFRLASQARRLGKTSLAWPIPRMTRYACDTSDMRIPHAVLRQALAGPQLVIQRVKSDDLAGAEGAAAYYATVLELLHLHDSAEDDVLWPRLRQRAPAQAALFDRMELQHATISAATDATESAVAIYARTPTEMNADRLATAIVSLATIVEPHLREEEIALLPVASVTMAQGEWNEIPLHAMSHYTGERPWLLFGLMADQMTETERDAMISTSPPALRGAWGAAGTHDYTRFMAAVCG
jgi:hemerythrin-like domain-containing protein